MTGAHPARPGNLPAEPNSFIGRERDRDELALLLAGARLLTLCGPGGIGKTRLALRLARDVAPRFPDGVWLTELADAASPAQIARRLAATLGVREEPGRPLAQALSATLHGQRLLLILDTCEHMADPCARLAGHLLAWCPGLRIIATSREPLRVRGETIWRVPPLDLPPPDLPPPGVLSPPGAVPPGALPAGAAASPDTGPPAWMRGEAMRLFAERAAAARTGFALTSDNAEAVARLCRTLDGLPLALELAAARVRALSAQQIADRLGDQFQFLTSSDRTAPPRQQTLHAAVDWSYQLLTVPEQILLRRVSVFSGWTLEMAEQVCADASLPASGVLHLLASLIDKSLVSVDRELDGTARYRLLDPIRQYAARLLGASGDLAEVRGRHRDCLVKLAESMAASAFVHGEPPWPQRVTLHRRALAEWDNITAALAVSADREDAGTGLRLCLALTNTWIVAGNVAEGADWFDHFLALQGKVAPAVRARALILRGLVAYEQQDYPRADACARAGLAACRPADPFQAAGLRVLALVRMRAGETVPALALTEEAIASARASGNDWEEGLARATKGAVLARQGLMREARSSYQTALEVLADNNGWGIAQVRCALGGLALARGDLQSAERNYQAALALCREIDARAEVARCLAGIGQVALARGELALSKATLTEGLRLSLATGQRLPVARCLEAFAALAAACGDPARAVRLAGAVMELRATAGGPADASRRLPGLLAPIRRRLGGEATATLLMAGQALTVGEAAACTSEIDPGRPIPRPATSSPPFALTPREWQIAVLVEHGLTNRAIASELVISQATVARHVANILLKLGFGSRAQVAAWAAGQTPRSVAS